MHSMGGDRFFGGDRRLLRPPNHNQNNQQQSLKCPRCDSLNTKFCYYNNYNLSQPRHFCKNCRRYWTKGGVLRNVPVGGGCRKSKRSNNNNNKPKNNNNNNNNKTNSLTTPQQPQQNCHSSSDSSSVTATEALSAPTSNAASNNEVLLENVSHEPKLFANPGFEMEQGGGVFSEIGSFTSLITSNEALSFGFGNDSNVHDATSFRFGSDQVPAIAGGGSGQWQQQKVMGLGIGGDHHNQEFGVPLEFSSLQNGKGGNGGFGPLDWHHAAADQGLFDLPNTVDQGYWTHTHWSEQDNPSTLFHLP